MTNKNNATTGEKATYEKVYDKESITPTKATMSLKDDLGFHPQLTAGMKLSDLETTVHTTIEYIRQKYPNEKNSMDRWLVLIGEEFGELCEAINDDETNNVIEEGTQTIAALYLMLLDFVQTKITDGAMSDIDRLITKGKAQISVLKGAALHADKSFVKENSEKKANKIADLIDKIRLAEKSAKQEEQLKQELERLNRDYSSYLNYDLIDGKQSKETLRISKRREEVSKQLAELEKVNKQFSPFVTELRNILEG